MQTVTFNCEVITPMFLGDADQKPELRPPSIRGAMRYRSMSQKNFINEIMYSKL